MVIRGVGGGLMGVKGGYEGGRERLWRGSALPDDEGCVGVRAGGCWAVEPARRRQRRRASRGRGKLIGGVGG